MQYNKVGIDSMVRRALSIRSSYTSLTDEFDEVRRYGQANGYPLSIIDTHIGIGLSNHLGKNDKKQEVIARMSEETNVRRNSLYWTVDWNNEEAVLAPVR